MNNDFDVNGTNRKQNSHQEKKAETNTCPIEPITQVENTVGQYTIVFERTAYTRPPERRAD